MPACVEAHCQAGCWFSCFLFLGPIALVCTRFSNIATWKKTTCIFLRSFNDLLGVWITWPMTCFGELLLNTADLNTIPHLIPIRLPWTKSFAVWHINVYYFHRELTTSNKGPLFHPFRQWMVTASTSSLFRVTASWTEGERITKRRTERNNHLHSEII